jgi:hypothetical protein
MTTWSHWVLSAFFLKMRNAHEGLLHYSKLQLRGWGCGGYAPARRVPDSGENRCRLGEFQSERVKICLTDSQHTWQVKNTKIIEINVHNLDAQLLSFCVSFTS